MSTAEYVLVTLERITYVDISRLVAIVYLSN